MITLRRANYSKATFANLDVFFTESIPTFCPINESFELTNCVCCKCAHRQACRDLHSFHKFIHNNAVKK